MNGLYAIILALSMTEPAQVRTEPVHSITPAQRKTKQQYVISKPENKEYQYLVYEIPNEEPKRHYI
jgi:hypothetical protein